jgi:hypothetical protein
MALTEKQVKVIEDLFESGGDEAAILQKYNISHNLWQKWLADKNFSEGIKSRFESSRRASQILLAKYIPLAAAKLVQLCDSKNQETSRKACLDILTLRAGNIETADSDEAEAIPAIEPGTASKILAVLAEKKTPQE